MFIVCFFFASDIRRWVEHSVTIDRRIVQAIQRLVRHGDAARVVTWHLILNRFLVNRPCHVHEEVNKEPSGVSYFFFIVDKMF